MNMSSRLITGALLSAGVALAGVGLGDGTAEAGTPPSGPYTWCPGDPPVQTGNLRTNPVIWDNTVCHSYYIVYHGQGNVAQNIWDGADPPGPPDAPPNLTPPLPPGWCWSLFIPTTSCPNG